eukprot:6848420-Alexandrium_andersonii.AAC.1
MSWSDDDVGRGEAGGIGEALGALSPFPVGRTRLAPGPGPALWGERELIPRAIPGRCGTPLMVTAVTVGGRLDGI